MFTLTFYLSYSSVSDFNNINQITYHPFTKYSSLLFLTRRQYHVSLSSGEIGTSDNPVGMLSLCAAFLATRKHRSIQNFDLHPFQLKRRVKSLIYLLSAKNRSGVFGARKSKLMEKKRPKSLFSRKKCPTYRGVVRWTSVSFPTSSFQLPADSMLRSNTLISAATITSSLSSVLLSLTCSLSFSHFHSLSLSLSFFLFLSLPLTRFDRLSIFLLS